MDVLVSQKRSLRSVKLFHDSYAARREGRCVRNSIRNNWDMLKKHKHSNLNKFDSVNYLWEQDVRVCKIFSFNAITPDLLFVFCALAFSLLSYLKTLAQSDWRGETAGRSAWVIDCGLKWHQSFWGTMWFLLQQLSLGNVGVVLSLRGIHLLMVLHV